MAYIAILILSIMVGASVIGNILVLVVIYKTKVFRQSQYIYKSSIAVSDIVWGSIISVSFFSDFVLVLLRSSFAFVELNSSKTSTKSVNNETIYIYDLQFLATAVKDSKNHIEQFKYFNFTLSATFLISILALMFAAFDRFVALSYPLKYKGYNTLKYAKIVTVLTWVQCFFLIVSLTFIYKPQFITTTIFLQPPFLQGIEEDWIMKQFSIHLISTFFSIWLIIVATILSIYINSKKSKQLNQSNSNRKHLEKQMYFILLVMVIATTICFSPTLFNHVCYHACSNSFYSKSLVKIFPVSTYLLATNSIWNFVIYNVMNKKFRTALMKLFKKN